MNKRSHPTRIRPTRVIYQSEPCYNLLSIYILYIASCLNNDLSDISNNCVCSFFGMTRFQFPGYSSRPLCDSADNLPNFNLVFLQTHQGPTTRSWSHPLSWQNWLDFHFRQPVPLIGPHHFRTVWYYFVRTVSFGQRVFFREFVLICETFALSDTPSFPMAQGKWHVYGEKYFSHNLESKKKLFESMKNHFARGC